MTVLAWMIRPLLAGVAGNLGVMMTETGDRGGDVHAVDAWLSSLIARRTGQEAVACAWSLPHATSGEARSAEAAERGMRSPAAWAERILCARLSSSPAHRVGRLPRASGDLCVLLPAVLSEFWQFFY